MKRLLNFHEFLYFLYKSYHPPSTSMEVGTLDMAACTAYLLQFIGARVVNRNIALQKLGLC